MRITITVGLFFLALGHVFSQTETLALTQPDKAQEAYNTKISVSLYGGTSFRTGVDLDLLSGNNKAFVKKLNTGYTVHLQPTYFFKPSFGLSLVGNLFYSNNTGNIGEGAQTISGAKQTDMLIFYGGALSGRYLYNSAYFGYSLMGGYQMMSSELKATVENENRTVKGTGGSWAAGANFEFGYSINKSISVIGSINYLYSIVSKVEVTNFRGEKETRTLKDEDRDNTSRFGTHIGVNYRF